MAGRHEGAQAEFRKAALDPSDSEAHPALGNIRENPNDFDGEARQLYRRAENRALDIMHTHQDVGRILLAKKDVDGRAIAELKQAEVLSPSDWKIHDLYYEALVATGQMDLAMTEFS